MRYLLEKEEIFDAASVGAVYDGEVVLCCSLSARISPNCETNEGRCFPDVPGQSILYLPGQVALAERTFDVSESEARGRPSRPDRPAPKILKIKVSPLTRVSEPYGIEKNPAEMGVHQITPALSIDMAQLAKLVAGRAGLEDGE